MTVRFERVIDISVPNGPGQHVYPGDPEPHVEQVHISLGRLRLSMAQQCADDRQAFTTAR